MDLLLANKASCIALLAAGLFFMCGLITGVWKYICMRRSPTFEARHYVNIAHRASLLYAFAAHLIAVFAAASVFPDTVNILAVTLLLVFFSAAIIHYIHLGLRSDSDNSMRDATEKDKRVSRA